MINPLSEDELQFGPSANDLLYHQIPQYYAWNENRGRWKRRERQLQHPTLGRLFHVPFSNTEKYYLRRLLMHVRGPVHRKALRLVNGVMHRTNQDACVAMGLTQNDQEWHMAMQRASQCRHPLSLRHLFVSILLNCGSQNTLEIWDHFKDQMSDDFPKERERQDRRSIMGMQPYVYNSNNEDYANAMSCIERDIHELGLMLGLGS